MEKEKRAEQRIRVFQRGFTIFDHLKMTIIVKLSSEIVKQSQISILIVTKFGALNAFHDALATHYSNQSD